MTPSTDDEDISSLVARVNCNTQLFCCKVLWNANFMKMWR